jgi:hypothetical protein
VSGTQTGEWRSLLSATCFVSFKRPQTFTTICMHTRAKVCPQDHIAVLQTLFRDTIVIPITKCIFWHQNHKSTSKISQDIINSR